MGSLLPDITVLLHSDRFVTACYYAVMDPLLCGKGFITTHYSGREWVVNWLITTNYRPRELADEVW